MREAIVSIFIIAMLLVPLHASEDRLCASSDFQIVAAPTKRVFKQAHSVTFRLTVANRTLGDVRIVPHLYPFDYEIEKYSRKRWRSVGGMVPASRFRRDMPLGPRDESEYRMLKSGDNYSTLFVVAPELLSKGTSGRFRIRVRAYVKDTADNDLRKIGCAMFTEPVEFTVKQ